MTRCFMPRSFLAVVLAGLFALAACAPADAPAPAATVAAPTSHGVLVAIRPVPATIANARGGDVRGNILGAVAGTAAITAADAGAAPDAAFEFILREDGGQTVSVVQTNEAGLRPGEHVVLSDGPWTRLSRAAD